MSKAPKYSFRVVEKRNKTWTAEIQRQATSKKKVVSKRQADFASEAEGTAWAEAELVTILANHVARNKRHDDSRAEQYQNKLKQAELAAATAALESSYDAEYSDDSAADAVDTEEQAVATEDQATDAAEQAKVAAELQEVAELASDDTEDTELADKPKFDFEVELEEAEAIEKIAKKKAKAAEKKAEVADDSATADGSDEVNSIYLQK